jgi:hypothetical protein
MQKLTTKLQETHELISPLFVGLLEECKAELGALSGKVGAVGRGMVSDLLVSINEVRGVRAGPAVRCSNCLSCASPHGVTLVSRVTLPASSAFWDYIGG